MIDITNEQTLRLAEAARIVGKGRGGKPLHESTVLRWILRGVPGPDGERVRLEGLRLGGHWITSREAIQRFAEALTPDLGAAPRLARSPTARKRSSEAAGRRLEKLGI